MQEHEGLRIKSQSPLATLYSVESPELNHKTKTDKVFNRLINDVNRRAVARKNLDELSKIMKIEQDEKLIGPKKKIDRDHAEIVFRRLIQNASDRQQAIELKNALRKIDEDKHRSPKIKLTSKFNDRRILSLIEYGKQTKLKIEAARRAKEMKLIEEVQTNVQKLHPKRKQDPQTWKRLQMSGNMQNRDKKLSNEIDNPYTIFTQSKSSKNLAAKTEKSKRINKPDMREKHFKEISNEILSNMDVYDYIKNKELEVKSTRVSMRPSLDLEKYEVEQIKSSYKPADAVNLMIPSSTKSIRTFSIETQEIGNIIPEPYNKDLKLIKTLSPQEGLRSHVSTKALNLTERLSIPHPESGVSIPKPVSHPDLSSIDSNEAYYEDNSYSKESQSSKSESSFYPSKTTPYSKLSKSIPSILDTLRSLVNIEDV